MTNPPATLNSQRHYGIAAAAFVSRVCHDMPSIVPLALLLKQFLKQLGLNDPYTGGLSSYALFLMLTKVMRSRTALAPLSHCSHIATALLQHYQKAIRRRLEFGLTFLNTTCLAVLTKIMLSHTPEHSCTTRTQLEHN
jgi:DNA polymerase sigma